MKFLGGGEQLFGKLFLKLDNKTEVVSCIQKLICKFEHQDNPKIYIKLHTFSEELYAYIKNFSNKKEEFDMNIIISLLETNNNFSDEIFGVLENIIGLMRQKAKINCTYVKEKERIGQDANNWIFSEDVFIQFSDDMSLGMISADREWISFFEDEFNNLEKESHEICIAKCDPLTYINRHANRKNSVRAAEHMPCLSFSLNEEILERSIHKDIPFRDELIKGILKNYRDYAIEELEEFINVFEKQGLIEFMETGKVDVFPYGVYEPILLKDRCSMLEYLINYLEERADKKAFLIKEGSLDLKGIHLEMRKCDNQLIPALFEIHFDKGKNEQIEITDTMCKEACWGFFEQLIKYGYVYTKEETLGWMKEILKKYTIKCVSLSNE